MIFTYATAIPVIEKKKTKVSQQSHRRLLYLILSYVKMIKKKT